MVGERVGVGALSVEFFLGEICGLVRFVGFVVVFARFLAFIRRFGGSHGERYGGNSRLEGKAESGVGKQSVGCSGLEW